MNCDISIHPKNHDCTLEFQLKNFKEENSFKEALAIIAMVAGDYSLDPEIELDELKELLSKADKDKTAIKFFIDEEEIEAEFF